MTGGGVGNALKIGCSAGRAVVGRSVFKRQLRGQRRMCQNQLAFVIIRLFLVLIYEGVGLAYRKKRFPVCFVSNDDH